MSEPLFQDADLQILRDPTGAKVVQGGADSEARLGKRVHDLVSAVRVVRFAVEALESGQRFEGKDGEAKIKSIARAATTLENELPWIEAVLSPNT